MQTRRGYASRITPFWVAVYLATLGVAQQLADKLDLSVSAWVSVPLVYLALVGFMELLTFTPTGKRGTKRVRRNRSERKADGPAQ